MKKFDILNIHRRLKQRYAIGLERLFRWKVYGILPWHWQNSLLTTYLELELNKCLKLISLKLTVRTTVIANIILPGLMIKHRWTPYVYKRNLIQIQVHGCWLKQLISPNSNTIFR